MVPLAMPLLEIHPCALFQERLLLQFAAGGETICLAKMAALIVHLLLSLLWKGHVVFAKTQCCGFEFLEVEVSLPCHSHVL